MFVSLLCLMRRRPPRSTLCPYTTLCRSRLPSSQRADAVVYSAATEVDRSTGTIRTTVTVLLPSNPAGARLGVRTAAIQDRKSTRLNSSHANISYAVFCLKTKQQHTGSLG